MTHLRQIMLEELERRNYAPGTIRSYIRTVEHFAQHFRCSPDKLGLDHIRQYQAAMFRTWKLAPNTVTQRLAALRFLYIQVLKRGWSAAETPYPKKVLRLPEILSQQEVGRLIVATETPFQRILIMTLYATGARRAEVARLKLADIDSQRMVVHIRGGKGRKDRDVMLSPVLLEALRNYWRGLQHKPTEWLFPGNRWHTSSRPITTKVLWLAVESVSRMEALIWRVWTTSSSGICFSFRRWNGRSICGRSSAVLWQRSPAHERSKLRLGSQPGGAFQAT
ncbi:tyrosine-type recombinase/integrase [Tunturiibacter lichenicola]|uniref:tyrosine-type recombinase/integrase n=1 Tax=Tunturiibacter lichenicola TaxID=2051959 RepID=UPI0021B21B7F|nr:site-specific integrase [Edaphobacter lichenicola]